ncbi:MAG: caspase family protein [Syntrophus sp. (in: bacteria)]
MNRKTGQFINLILYLILITISLPGTATAAPERRTALVIGNGAYSSGPLKNPVNDATDMAANLQRFGFAVTLKKNASHQEMEDSIREFGDQLKKGGVGLFFYAGHGVQIGGRNYLLPVGARINRDTDVKFQAVDTEIVLAEMGNAGNNLNIVILDACRDNPFGKSFRTAGRGLAIISDAPKGTFITYSTSPGKIAADGSGRNSPYTDSLIRHANTAGLPIEEVFKEVRKELGKKTGGQQVPWELSSLEGQFYFSPGKSGMSGTASTDDLDAEIKKLEAEQRRLGEDKSSFAKKKALEEKRRQIEDERERLAAEQEAERQAVLDRKQAKKTTTLAMAKRPPQPTAGETSRDGRFIAYNNGTVLDTQTNLVWAAKDNGDYISWPNAKSYCENYRGGGYSDWRMPTQDELAGLYDTAKTYRSNCKEDVHLTELIRITCFAHWTSKTSEGTIQGEGRYSWERSYMNVSTATVFSFNNGRFGWSRQSNDVDFRALPVRSAK